MDFTPGKGSSSIEDFPNTGNGENCHVRHSPKQTEHLEEYFKVCTNPTEGQREQLAWDLGLAPRQVRFWFQNKRNQIRIQSDKAINIALREENARILSENLAMKEKINNFCCPRCNRFTSDDDGVKQQAIKKLRLENTVIKQKLAIIVAIFGGKPGV